MNGEVEQIIETAWRQHDRGELTLLELETLNTMYGQTGFIIDGDKMTKEEMEREQWRKEV